MRKPPLDQQELDSVEEIAHDDDAYGANSDKGSQQLGLYCLFQHNQRRQAQSGNGHHKGKNGTQTGSFKQQAFCHRNGAEDVGIHGNTHQSSENPLVRIFALLDRRLGKRRLLALEKSMEQELDWVRAFYVIRMQAEGLMEKE